MSLDISDIQITPVENINEVIKLGKDLIVGDLLYKVDTDQNVVFEHEITSLHREDEIVRLVLDGERTTYFQNTSSYNHQGLFTTYKAAVWSTIDACRITIHTLTHFPAKLKWARKHG